MNRRRFIATTSAAAAALTLPAAAAAKKETLNIFCWSEYIPQVVIDTFAKANKVHGFDCPGCAFPDKKGHPLVDSCEQGQKAIAWEMTRKAVGAEFFAGRTPEELRAHSDFDLEFQGRLTHPVVYEKASGTYRGVSWPEAYAIAARISLAPGKGGTPLMIAVEVRQVMSAPPVDG